MQIRVSEIWKHEYPYVYLYFTKLFTTNPHTMEGKLGIIIPILWIKNTGLSDLLRRS